MTLALMLPQLSQITACSLYRCAHACAVLCSVAQSCLTLCDPMDCSPPGSSVHEILQARILEWVAKLQRIFLTQGLKPGLCRLLYWQVDSLPLCHLGSPLYSKKKKFFFLSEHTQFKEREYPCFHDDGIKQVAESRNQISVLK